MVMRDLIQLIAVRGSIDVEFTKGVEDMEGYPELGMRATILNAVDQHDDVMKIRVSYEKYDEFNKQFEGHNYWGVERNGQDPASATYTARETGWYKVEEDLYVMADDDVSRTMTLLSNSNLYDTWNNGNKELSYVLWLEALVTEHALPS